MPTFVSFSWCQPSKLLCSRRKKVDEADWHFGARLERLRQTTVAVFSRRLLPHHLVNRILHIRREIDHPRRANAYAGRDVARQPARRSRQSDRQIARDLRDG